MAQSVLSVVGVESSFLDLRAGNAPSPMCKEKIQVTFGTNLRALREAAELTQQQLAEIADLHTNYVSSVERGERNLSLVNIVRLAIALQVSPAMLIGTLAETAKAKDASGARDPAKRS